MLARAAVVLALLLGAVSARAEEAVRTGTIRYAPAANEEIVAERFRLAEHTFEFEQRPVETSSEAIEIFEVTFPSPVETPTPENNTVYCEYFRPVAAGKEQVPAVIVLHILGGDFDLARLFGRTLAHEGVAALFLKMPYYGPRRPADGARSRTVTPDPRETVAGMTQAVLDIRRAAAWLSEQDEIDQERLGIFGISLGGITAALAAGAEPRLSRVCLMLAGGDIGRVGWESREISEVRERWLDGGGTKESFLETMRVIDPAEYAENVRGREILMLNARYDEVIPPACTESLWRKLGEPEIVWLDAGHYSAMRFIFDGLNRVTRFFDRPR